MPLLFWCQLLKGWSGRWHYILPDFSLMPHKARWPIPRAAASPSQRKGWKFSHQSFPIATDSYSTCLLGGSDLWKIEKKPTLGRSQKLPGSGSGKDSNRKTKQWRKVVSKRFPNLHPWISWCNPVANRAPLACMDSRFSPKSCVDSDVKASGPTGRLDRARYALDVIENWTLNDLSINPSGLLWDPVSPIHI